jgi:8-oxoguanine deaminase
MLLVHDADWLVTMDHARREIRGGSVLTKGGVIQCLGTTEEVQAQIAADPSLTPQRRIDASGCVVLPGLVNGHHHLYQTLTRAIGTGGGRALFDWLRLLYPIWGKLDPSAARVSARVGLAELILSGATTVADHLYLFPNGTRLDDTIEAAREMGVRFHPTRGSMSVGASAGGLPPDYLVEDERSILRDCERVISSFHDPEPYSFLRIALAPCSPFSVSGDLMRESARLARSHSEVRLHTHLAETIDEERYCVGRFGKRPLEYAESLEWTGSDVWFAHMVHPNAQDIHTLARSGSGVCHCPSSNMILASGIAPIRALRDANVPVGLGVDGSASNDQNHLLGEARQSMLLQRVGWPGFESRADRMSAREALEVATLGGAAILGREDIGCLEPGKAADIVGFRTDTLQFAGAQGDPVAGLLTTAPANVWFSLVGGRLLVAKGELLGVDLGKLAAEQRAASVGMLRAAGVMA